MLLLAREIPRKFNLASNFHHKLLEKRYFQQTSLKKATGSLEVQNGGKSSFTTSRIKIASSKRHRAKWSDTTFSPTLFLFFTGREKEMVRKGEKISFLPHR